MRQDCLRHADRCRKSVAAAVSEPLSIYLRRSLNCADKSIPVRPVRLSLHCRRRVVAYQKDSIARTLSVLTCAQNMRLGLPSRSNGRALGALALTSR